MQDSNTYYVKAPGTVTHDGKIYPPGAQLPQLTLSQSKALLLNNALTTLKPNKVVDAITPSGEVEPDQEEINELVRKLGGKTTAQPAAPPAQPPVNPPQGQSQGQPAPQGGQQQPPAQPPVNK